MYDGKQPDEADDRPADAAADLPSEVLRTMLDAVRRLVESRGWDAPFTVYGVRWNSINRWSDSGMGAVTVELLLEGEHPFEDLPGLYLPGDFDAAILATEGWQYPDRLTGASQLGLELEGPPSEVADRRENRLFSYLSRSGEAAALLLAYEHRDREPDVLFSEGVLAGRVQDVFRRFVGLPVTCDERVDRVLGRFWLGALLLNVIHDPELRLSSPAAANGDPLETFLDPLREQVGKVLGASADTLPKGLRHYAVPDDPGGEALKERVLKRYALEKIALLEWEDVLLATRSGILDFAIDEDVLRWCDAGMFARLVVEHVSTQRELLDALLLQSPVLAAEVVEELVERNWLDHDVSSAGFATESSTGAVRQVASAPDDPCPCGSNRRFGECHGVRPE